MFRLLIFAYLELFRLEIPMSRGKFERVHATVRKCPTTRSVKTHLGEADILRAMELACVFYFKEVRCLQRSAATTCLLRRYGIAAEMVIGVQHLPFRAHAWVEFAGTCLNDKPYVPEMYCVLDRC